MTRHGGLALIVTLWVLVLLSILCLSFAHMARVESRLSDGYYERSRAHYLAEAGLQRMLRELQDNSPGYTAGDGPWVELLSEDEDWPFEDERFEVHCTDECGKLNLNTATEEMLSRLPGMTPELVDCILDWRDQDDSPRAEGAEEDYYSTLQPRYSCANRPFVTLEELLLVKGMTPDLLYGSGPSVPQQQQQQQQELPRLADLVTVFSLDQDVDAQGQPRINVNTASAEELQDRLGDAVSEQDVQAIINRRQQSGEFDSVGDVWNVPGMDREKMSKIVDLITVRGGEQTTQTGEGAAGETPTIPGLENLPGGSGTPSSPGFPSGGSGSFTGSRQAAQVPQLPGMPDETTSPEGLIPTMPGEEEGEAQAGGGAGGGGGATLLRGMINLNTAPLEVILTLPEMTEDVAQAIVSARDAEPFTDLGAVLQVEEIQPPLFQAIANYVTVHSRSFRCVARGEVPDHHAVAEITTLIDAGQSTPRVIYFRRGDTLAQEYRPAGVLTPESR